VYVYKYIKWIGLDQGRVQRCLSVDSDAKLRISHKPVISCSFERTILSLMRMWLRSAGYFRKLPSHCLKHAVSTYLIIMSSEKRNSQSVHCSYLRYSTCNGVVIELGKENSKLGGWLGNCAQICTQRLIKL
jgi:hypothetical protein